MLWCEASLFQKKGGDLVWKMRMFILKYPIGGPSTLEDSDDGVVRDGCGDFEGRCFSVNICHGEHGQNSEGKGMFCTSGGRLTLVHGRLSNGSETDDLNVFQCLVLGRLSREWTSS